MIIYNPFEVTKTKYLFFTGKGGVGKTSAACATAVSLADQGQRIPAVAVGMKPVKKIVAALMTVVLTELFQKDAVQIIPKGAVRMTVVLMELFRRDAAQIVQRAAADLGKGINQT